jgi:hypothetical protein
MYAEVAHCPTITPHLMLSESDIRAADVTAIFLPLITSILHNQQINSIVFVYFKVLRKAPLIAQSEFISKLQRISESLGHCPLC